MLCLLADCSARQPLIEIRAGRQAGTNKVDRKKRGSQSINPGGLKSKARPRKPRLETMHVHGKHI